MNNRTNVVPKEMEVIKQRFHYNPGVKTAGQLLFMAGQVGRDQNLNVVEGRGAICPGLRKCEGGAVSSRRHF
jgi:enamine deaminase RidA (YjgF/YER057c/UK114 family)